MESCEILNVPNSDHKGVYMYLDFGEFKRGPSYWKFNNSFLKDVSYVNMINDLITEVNTLHCTEKPVNIK